ncbi:restriction endonuclease [Helicobacter cappadocius]|uniref:Restriction endonuclease n=1 Tax=Helicobacter cappadocius TaxID=3063998 RepID=A0AA90PR01_9HELI|nr:MULTISPECIES: restriction endonuclease [unclassified Helicobacter]MDO7253400.1 restriction endonuclease [Helicobacter sp. faydin-H75]MDP2539336.1 restriction endonuclease [Helicobacter sp. faydin-H76]
MLKKLEKIVEYLKSLNLNLSEQSRDGRINSAFNEDELLNIIKIKFPEIQYPKKRDWKDFCFEEDGQYIPVNIKITKTDTTDNLNCKVGIYYALTGRIPSFDNQIDWGNYLRNLREDITPNNQDYYFLIVNKNNPKDIYIASLKTINKIVPNGNNLPFQAKWDENKYAINRTFEEARDYLLKTMGKSFRLRSRVYDQFVEYFPEFKRLID